MHVVVDWYAGAPPCKPSAHRCKRRAEGSPPYDDLFLCSGEFHCRTTCSSLRIGCVLTWRSFGSGVCLPGLAGAVPVSYCHTPAGPSSGGFAFTAVKATVVETIHRMVSKSHLSNPQPPSAKTEKGHSFWNVLLFWWKVVDSNHRSHRRQIYSLFPLATRETFHIRLPA